MGQFDGKGVIVTGASYGIGRSTALEFAREGANVTIADVDDVAGKSVVSEIEKIGSSGLFVLADVSDSVKCDEVVSRTIDKFNSLDVLVNNVGIQPKDSYRNVEDTPESLWDRIIDVNLKSCFLMSKFSIPQIRKVGGGAIINVASVQGIRSKKLVPAYAASKGGLLSLTRQMSLDYIDDNIRVLAVCPGGIDTKMVRDLAANEGANLDDIKGRYALTHPIGRIGNPVEIANVILFLASDKASFMTGEYICVDGGYNAVGSSAGAARDSISVNK
tara:strand:+ start:3177 stop:3998 length:822 start_codon:yes stop_codon:yes gene_type:complete